MSRKTRDRHRREQIERARQKSAAPQADPQPLSHRRLEERAVRGGWIDGPKQEKIIARLERTLDDPEAGHREATAAAKTLIYADLGERRLALAAQMHADRIASAPPPTTEPAAEIERPKRIIIPDVDDRLEARED